MKVIDPLRGDELLTFTLSDDLATHLAWSPDGLRLAAATQNGQIHVWDASQGSEFSWHGSRQAELAQAYFRRGDPSARQEFLKVAPDTLEFWYTRGIAHAQLGQFDQAEEEFGKALLPRRLHLDFAWSHAWSLLGAERLEAYRDACQLMAREYDDGKPNPNELYIAWLCSLVPSLEFHSELALRLVTQDIRQTFQEFDNYQLLFAAARLYRDGYLETAISRTDRAVQPTGAVVHVGGLAPSRRCAILSGHGPSATRADIPGGRGSRRGASLRGTALRAGVNSGPLAIRDRVQDA